jgi:hypothetical protein
VADLADYLDLTVGQAREQFRALASRRPAHGSRQVAFLPTETLLCLAASFLINHRHFGGSTAHQAPEPVPSLARLFSRPPSSVLAKMANLDGSRSHGARWDALAGAIIFWANARIISRSRSGHPLQYRSVRLSLHERPDRCPDLGALGLLGVQRIKELAQKGDQRGIIHIPREAVQEDAR